MTSGARTLDRLRVGESACVAQISGDDDVSLRLMEMGIIPGTGITLIGVAPLGDPLELDLRGYHLSVRRAEAARVELTQ